jgi:hypothetical protein
MEEVASKALNMEALCSPETLVDFQRTNSQKIELFWLFARLEIIS